MLIKVYHFQKMSQIECHWLQLTASHSFKGSPGGTLTAILKESFYFSRSVGYLKSPRPRVFWRAPRYWALLNPQLPFFGLNVLSFTLKNQWSQIVSLTRSSSNLWFWMSFSMTLDVSLIRSSSFKNDWFGRNQLERKCA